MMKTKVVIKYHCTNCIPTEPCILISPYKDYDSPLCTSTCPYGGKALWEEVTRYTLYELQIGPLTIVFKIAKDQRNKKC